MKGDKIEIKKDRGVVNEPSGYDVIPVLIDLKCQHSETEWVKAKFGFEYCICSLCGEAITSKERETYIELRLAVLEKIEPFVVKCIQRLTKILNSFKKH